MKHLPSFEDFLNESYYESEEILNEAFKSSILQNLTSDRRGRIGKEFFDTLSKMGIAASEISNTAIIQADPKEGAKITKSNPNAILIYYSNKEKPNPYAGEYAYRDEMTIQANIPLAIVKGKLYMGLAYDRWASKGGRAQYKLVPLKDAGKHVGAAGKTGGKYGDGLTSLSRMAEVSDILYVIDPANVPSSTDLRKYREETRKGAIAFLDDKDFKQQNQSRYEAILRERASKDDVDAMIQDAIDTLTDQIKNAIAEKKKSRHGEMLIALDPKGREIKMSDAGNQMSSILSDYSRYVEYKNSAEISQERFGEMDGYYNREADNRAKSIKDRLNKIKNLNYAW